MAVRPPDEAGTVRLGFLVNAVFAAVIYWLAIGQGLDDRQRREHIEEVEREVAE